MFSVNMLYIHLKIWTSWETSTIVLKEFFQNKDRIKKRKEKKKDNHICFGKDADKEGFQLHEVGTRQGHSHTNYGV